ncbi:hypothetical protein [Parafilimonas sp.]|uniref:hypothetical protein n=1 Tax=Parafilimonas sp. TaxID=1969739 RepID=UPI0039E3AA67
MNTLDMYIEKGRKEGIEKKSWDVIESLLIKLGITDEEVADIAEVPVSFVKKVRAAINKKK